MTLSMRRQTILEKKRQARDMEIRRKRLLAVEILRRGGTVAEAARVSRISCTTGDRIYAAMRGDDGNLQKLLDPAKNRAGRLTFISKDESELIKHRIRFAASRGFAFDHATLKGVMAQIASDGRKGFKTATGAPSDDPFADGGARNRRYHISCSRNKESGEI